MDGTLNTAIRYFPLIGRPRPDCPTLQERVTELAERLESGEHQPLHSMADAAYVLNKAALIASDARMADLARQWCWIHINAYLNLGRPLSILEARYMLEPVLNLARLQIRADDGSQALGLLEAMFQTVTQRRDLTVGTQVLPTSALVGEPAEERKLKQWLWLSLLTDGIRALSLANRWGDAADLARTHDGVGGHLLEGRQAVILDALWRGDSVGARALLAECTPTQPWEQQVVACLTLMAAGQGDAISSERISTAIQRYTAFGQASNYASYRAQLGLALVALMEPTQPQRSAGLLHSVARHGIQSGDGYAVRDILKYPGCRDGITGEQQLTLENVARNAGLGVPLPPPVLTKLDGVVAIAADTLHLALQQVYTRVRPVRAWVVRPQRSDY